uniref:Lipoprotein n=1 Tax=Panagrellus redivivus TaxID=6233 RepID=A0A7E4UU32_PANRE
MLEDFVIGAGGALILGILSTTLLPGCGGKKKDAPEGGGDGKQQPMPTKKCNTKSGLLNDDPDLKSDKLMAKPAEGGGDGAAAPSASGAPTKSGAAPPAPA